MAGRAHFPGAVPAPSVVPFIRTADAAILLYYPLADNWELALPNGFFRSLAAGLPLLHPADLTEIGAMARRHGLDLPILARDPATIAAGVSRLLADPDVRAAQGQASLTAAEALGWESEEARLGKMMARIIAGARPH